MKYRFYSIFDSKKETIGVFNCTNSDPWEIASKIKRLKLKLFKKLFQIEEFII